MLGSGSDMMMALQQARVGLSSLRGMFLTHGHYDHAAGAAAIQARTECPVYYSEEERSLLNGEADRRNKRSLVPDIPESGWLVTFHGLTSRRGPKPIAADRHVVDGEILFGDFQVIATPGHTTGHLALYHAPSKALFAGDALAVVGEELRCLAGLATPNKPAARASIARMLDRDIRMILPGHRTPLTKDVDRKKDTFVRRLESGERWPLFG